MKKALTYARYMWDYLKHGEFVAILSSLKYLINKRSHHSDRIIHTSVGTFFCRKNTNDFQFANYYYEWGVKKYLLDRKNKFSVFIDGGSGIGDYSVLLSRYGIRCLAFEPVENNFDVLLKNLELNNLKSKVQAFPVGLGDRNETVNFVFNPINTGASHIASFDEHANCTAVIRTFDSLLPKLNIDKAENILIKLDLEGMEVEAIRGASNFIRDYPNVTLVIEDKHTGQSPIKGILNELAQFEFNEVDKFNISAKKINKKSFNLQ